MSLGCNWCEQQEEAQLRLGSGRLGYGAGRQGATRAALSEPQSDSTLPQLGGRLRTARMATRYFIERLSQGRLFWQHSQSSS